jgi:hypothetical protein
LRPYRGGEISLVREARGETRPRSVLPVVAPVPDVAGRRAKRFRPRFTIPVAFLGGGVRFTGVLLDISTTGLLLRCEKHIELGTVGRMAIPVGYERSRVVAVATRRLPGVGIAFEFSHMSPHDRELLRRLLQRLTRQSGP